MNELLIRKHVKNIVKHGVDKYIAKEIVEVALDTSKGGNVETYINYALDLVYGLGFSNRIDKIS